MTKRTVKEIRDELIRSPGERREALAAELRESTSSFGTLVDITRHLDKESKELIPTLEKMLSLVKKEEHYAEIVKRAPSDWPRLPFVLVAMAESGLVYDIKHWLLIAEKASDAAPIKQRALEEALQVSNDTFWALGRIFDLSIAGSDFQERIGNLIRDRVRNWTQAYKACESLEPGSLLYAHCVKVLAERSTSSKGWIQVERFAGSVRGLESIATLATHKIDELLDGAPRPNPTIRHPCA